MKDTVLQYVEKELVHLGVNYTILPGKNHHKVRMEHKGKKVSYSVPKTTSDWRARMNALSQIRNMLGVRDQHRASTVKVSMFLKKVGHTMRVGFTRAFLQELTGSSLLQTETRVNAKIIDGALVIEASETGKYKITATSTSGKVPTSVPGFITITKRDAMLELLEARRPSQVLPVNWDDTSAVILLPPSWLRVSQLKAKAPEVEVEPSPAPEPTTPEPSPEPGERQPILTLPSKPVTVHAPTIHEEPVNKYDTVKTALGILVEALEETPDVRLRVDPTGKPYLTRIAEVPLD